MDNVIRIYFIRDNTKWFMVTYKIEVIRRTVTGSNNTGI